MTFIRAHASVLAVLVTTAAAVVAILAVTHEAEVRAEEDLEQAARIEDARTERLGQICTSVMDNRQAVIDLTGVVLAGETQALPLTSLPEFAQLDPASQAYFRALAVQLEAGSGGESVRDRIDAFRQGLLAAPLPEFCQ
jgi:hypothetical protein